MGTLQMQKNGNILFCRCLGNLSLKDSQKNALNETDEKKRHEIQVFPTVV